LRAAHSKSPTPQIGSDMGKPFYEMASWDATANAAISQPPGAWQATRTQTVLPTRMMDDRDAELEEGQIDVGRRVDRRTVELFVACEPPDAVQQQLEHRRSSFIAIHDIGTASSRRMISGLGAAGGHGVQRLVIRRQGAGIALATIEFAEVPTKQGQWLRVYSTQIEADTQVRHALAHLLLAYASLSVLMVGELPAHALDGALNPLADAITAGPWINTHMLVLPLASAAAIPGAVAKLSRHRGLEVRSTPQVTRPSDAWSYISSSWNRLRESAAGAALNLPEFVPHSVASPSALAASPTTLTAPTAGTEPSSTVAGPARVDGRGTQAAPLPMRPMPDIPSAKKLPTPAAAGDEEIDRYVEQVLKLAGVISVCVFDSASQRSVAHGGARPGPAMLAIQGATMLAAISDAARKLGLPASLPAANMTLTAHHLILHPLPRPAGLVLHAVIDKTRVNLTTARLQIQRLDSLFEASAL
jgi:hypothetical protein